MVMSNIKTIFGLRIASLLVACTCAQGSTKFGYSGANGPDKWGSLSPEFKLCSQGKQQSPIDIVKNDAVYNPQLEALVTKDYVPTNATLIDSGHNMEIRYEKTAGKLILNEKTYNLIDMLWHSPSEHTIDGERYAVELQLVHKSDDGGVTIVAILYQIGGNDAFLLQIRDVIQKLSKVHAEGGEHEAQMPTGILQTRSFKRRSRKYYTYVGSLTEPPCTENITWIILGKVRQMTQEQANSLKEFLNGEYQNNARPTQPLNGRTVQLYDEGQRAMKAAMKSN